MPLDPTVRSEVIRNILQYESKVNHLYLDSVGKVTVGVGHMIPNRQAMATIPMYKKTNNFPGAPASLQEKQQEYDNIAKQKRNYKASWYEQHTSLVMRDADINAQLNKHVDAFYRELSSLYSKVKGYPEDFDKLDKGIQAALFDMIFNLGAINLSQQFKNFNNAIKAGDWKKAALESNRPQLNPLRNNYVKQKFLTAPMRKATTP